MIAVRERPRCAACLAEWQAVNRVPAVCLVETVLVLRDTSTARYMAIVKCHGETESLDLGPEASEASIAALVAFKRKGKPNGKASQ